MDFNKLNEDNSKSYLKKNLNDIYFTLKIS